MSFETIQQTQPAISGKSFATYVLTQQNTLQRFARLNKFEETMRDAGQKGLVIYCHPATVLEAVLSRQENYALALESWINEARDILPVIRKFRINLNIFEHTTPQDSEALSAFKVAFKDQSPPPEMTGRKPSGSRTLQAIASLAVSQSAVATRYLAELQASSLAPPDCLVPVPDTHELLKELEQQEQLTQELEALRTYRDDTEIVRAHLLEQLADLQAAFEQSERDKSDLKQRLTAEKKLVEDTQKHLSDTQQQLNLVYASTSWRISAPLRAIMRLIKR